MVFNQDVHQKCIFEYLQALDNPRSLTCWLLYVNMEHVQLANLEWNPIHYNDLISARDSLAATKFLSKANFLKTDLDLKRIALESFLSSERKCKDTNTAINSSRLSDETQELIMRARAKIEFVLTDFSADEFVDACDWGPGSTTLIQRRFATAPNKFQIESGITRDAHDFVKDWFKLAYPLWEVEPEFQIGSKIVTVPKNSKTDRTIAIEPGLNLWFQKGIGTLIRRRLKRIGIDLDSQDHNQSKSRIASRYNDLATVDFSAASDTISKALVERLLPPRWLNLCSAFRSSYAKLQDKPIELEKFSSMGNGFTFELESLIFYSLATVVVKSDDRKHISVFGDDVILPCYAFDAYSTICEAVGFSINQAKSYSSTYYRESCGSHYWNGICIKPIFLKEPLYDRYRVLRFANSVRLLAARRNLRYGCDRKLRRVWLVACGSLGRNVPKIPLGFGDVGLVSNLHESSVTKPGYGIEGFYTKIWAVIAVKYEFDNMGLLLSKLKSIEKSGPLKIGDLKVSNDQVRVELASIGNEIPIPMRTKLANKRLLVPRWVDIGPWI